MVTPLVNVILTFIVPLIAGYPLNSCFQRALFNETALSNVNLCQENYRHFITAKISKYTTTNVTAPCRIYQLFPINCQDNLYCNPHTSVKCHELELNLTQGGECCLYLNRQWHHAVLNLIDDSQCPYIVNTIEYYTDYQTYSVTYLDTKPMHHDHYTIRFDPKHNFIFSNVDQLKRNCVDQREDVLVVIVGCLCIVFLIMMMAALI